MWCLQSLELIGYLYILPVVSEGLSHQFLLFPAEQQVRARRTTRICMVMFWMSTI